jgi:hypothetical protein
MTTTTTTISQHNFYGAGDSETCISIIENLKEEYGLFVWPCSVILAEYVWQHRSRFRDSSILEVNFYFNYSLLKSLDFELITELGYVCLS